MRTQKEIKELLDDLEHFYKTSQTRELNSFENGIKETIEKILKDLMIKECQKEKLKIPEWLDDI